MVAYVIAGVVVAAIALAVVVLIRRRAKTSADTDGNQTLPPPAPPENPPMTGLEAALAKVTDREGRPIGERIDAEAPLVDELRVPDDTGPVLRRALDRVEHHPDAETDDASGESPPSTDDAEPHDRHDDQHDDQHDDPPDDRHKDRGAG